MTIIWIKQISVLRTLPSAEKALKIVSYYTHTNNHRLYKLNCVSPDSYVETPNPDMVVLGAGASRQCWSPEGGALLRGLVLLQESSARSLASPTM